jgi:hypothetical protein
LGFKLLSVKQQKFLIVLLSKHATKKNNGLYSSKAFYKMVAHLRNNGMIYSRKSVKGTSNEYYLTVKGQLAARIFASFNDAPPMARERYALW